jgi:TadE-like protein
MSRGSVREWLRPSRSRNSRRRKSAGQSLVEFALILPVSLSMVLIGLDFGRSYLGWVALNNVVRDAANFASIHPTAWNSATPDLAAQAQYADLITKEAAGIDCELPKDVPAPSFPNGTAIGEPASVTITCIFKPLTPVITDVVGTGVQITSSAAFPIRYGVINGIPVGPQLPADFSISANPSAVTILQGGSGSTTINTAILAGNAQTISLTETGEPAGVTATLNPTSLQTGASSTLSLDVPASTPTGTYFITVTGVSTTETHSTTVTLKVISTAINDFILSASTYTVSVTAGGTGTTTIGTTLFTGSPETIALSTSGLPANVTAAFSPTSVTTGGSSTLTFTAASSAVAGTYLVTVTGTAPSATHSITVTLVVSAVQCTVPDLVGDKTNTVQTKWAHAGFTQPVVFNPLTGQGGNSKVTSQNVAAGTSQPCTSTVVTVDWS